VAASLKIAGVCGKAGSGKDTFYEHVLKPRGFIRWQMSLQYKVWLAGQGRYDFDDIFYRKPPEVRKVLQEEITALRHEHGEAIWFHTFAAWMAALHEIVGVECAGVAVTDLRFLIEMRGLKAMGGKILHLQAADEQANVAPELRGHRSETELDRPEVFDLRDARIYNTKDGVERLKRKGECVLAGWGWL
jgi:hypothetical protein